MLEGKQLLETGELTFPLKESQFILDAKLGKYKLKEILDFSEQMENEIVELEKKSKLPSSPRYKEVNELLKTILKDAVFNPYYIM